MPGPRSAHPRRPRGAARPRPGPGRRAHALLPIAGPQEGHPVRFALDDMERKSFAATAMEMRFLSGQPLTGELPELDTTTSHAPVGHATVWMRLLSPPAARRAPLAPRARRRHLRLRQRRQRRPPLRGLPLHQRRSRDHPQPPPRGRMDRPGRPHAPSPRRHRLGRERPARRARPARACDAGAGRAAALSQSNANGIPSGSLSVKPPPRPSTVDAPGMLAEPARKRIEPIGARE